MQFGAKQDSKSSIAQVGINADIYYFPLAAPPKNGETLNLCYCSSGWLGPVILATKSLKVYGYPTETELSHIFAYARSLGIFVGATDVRSITIPQGQVGSGSYRYIMSKDGGFAVGINADDGKLWFYNGQIASYGSWWQWLNEASARGF